ncbi:hypothetical protein HBA94_07565 [Ochrobactrum sp. GRS2]|nr:hypothetical protein [Ochrobactrum sp. GRS2]
MYINYKNLRNAEVTHGLNLINAYQDYQYSATSIDTTCIYEFTGHLQPTSWNSTNIQFSIGKKNNHLHHQICRSLVGNNYKKLFKHRLQPMMICFYDQEGSRYGVSSKQCEFPHIHGLLIIHPSTKENFMKIVELDNNNRLRLKTKNSNFRQVTFSPVYGGIEGIKKFIDYCYKSDRIKARTGESIYKDGVYPKNPSWDNYFYNIPNAELYKYH